jgi:hypothetical protein
MKQISIQDHVFTAPELMNEKYGTPHPITKVFKENFFLLDNPFIVSIWIKDLELLENVLENKTYIEKISIPYFLYKKIEDDPRLDQFEIEIFHNNHICMKEKYRSNKSTNGENPFFITDRFLARMSENVGDIYYRQLPTTDKNNVTDVYGGPEWEEWNEGWDGYDKTNKKAYGKYAAVWMG